MDQPIEKIVFPDQHARLFARLGIKSEETDTSPDDMESVMASLCHRQEKTRIHAAHALADLYAKLSPEKQMYARITLILMTWRDTNKYARIAAIEALGRTEAPDVSEALHVALRDEEHDISAAAARALGEIHGKTLRNE